MVKTWMTSEGASVAADTEFAHCARTVELQQSWLVQQPLVRNWRSVETGSLAAGMLAIEWCAWVAAS